MRLTPALLLLAVPVCALAQAPAMGPGFQVNKTFELELYGP
jgi:hypothetical protein